MGIDKIKAESGLQTATRKAEMRRAVFLDRDGVINRALEHEVQAVSADEPRRV